MSSKKVAHVVVGLPVEGHFDYLLEPAQAKEACIGQRARVSFGQGSRIGYITGFSANSRFARLKPVTKVLDTRACLNEPLLKLADEFSAYYGCSVGEAIEAILPANLRNRRTSIDIPKEAVQSEKPDKKPKAELLLDKTRFSRWELLKEKIDACLLEERDVLFLIPEGALMDEAVTQIKDYFDVPVAVFDRQMSPKQELEEWCRVFSGERRIVVGTRSSVFAPLLNLGLIIIYDEENPAYKQEQSPHYHVRDVAMMRSVIHAADILYVSSAPSAEVWYGVEKKEIALTVLEGKDKTPTQLVDLSNYNFGKTSIVSYPLRNNIESVLDKRGKVLLYLNRKGFSTRTSCNNCGYVAKCERCDVNLTYSYTKRKLICRLCSASKPLPKICPKCGSSYIRSTGTGVEKLESDLSLIFPYARIGHFDADSLSIPKDTDIIIATQAIHKIIGVLSVDLIAVLSIDGELHRMDFRSAQKAFSTFMRLKQYAKGKFMVQTSNIDDYCVKALAKDDYDLFYKEELKGRKELDLPPYRHLVAVGLRGVKEETVLKQVNELHAELEKACKKGMEVSDPHPDMLPKLRDKYRFTVILKGKNVKKMVLLVKQTLKRFKKRGVTVTINVD